MSIQRVFRSRYLAVRFEDRQAFDAAALLRGEIRPQVLVGPKILSVVGDREVDADEADLALLRRVPSEGWTAVDDLESEGVARETIERLCHSGVLLSDAPKLAELRAREEAMRAARWGESAARFHRVSQWRHRSGPGTEADSEGGNASGEAGGDGEGSSPSLPITEIERLREDAAEAAGRYIAEHGPPPDIVPSRPGPRDAEISLPAGGEREGDLFRALARRRSCRTFASRAVSREDLATVLRWTFGCHGLFHLGPSYEVQHKTSPSGGAMHPVEAYPLVMDVEGVDPGLYHYGSMTHRLSPARSLEVSAGRELAVRLSSGQDFFGRAGVVVLLVARFHRSFWKYPEVERAYSVVMQDLGHLSQTFYLLATHLGLGAIYTGAVAGDVACEALGMEPTEEGPLGLLALGHPREDADSWLPIEDFDPTPA